MVARILVRTYRGFDSRGGFCWVGLGSIRIEMTSPIRRPRHYATKCRYKPYKVGDLVWYWHAGQPKPFRVAGYDDCYDWGRKPGEPPSKRADYALYIELEPVGIDPRRRISRQGGWHEYNIRLWRRGYIGHSVDISEVFASHGEALFVAMMR